MNFQSQSPRSQSPISQSQYSESQSHLSQPLQSQCPPRTSPPRAQYFEVKSPAKIQEAIGAETPIKRERFLLPRRSLKAKKIMLDYSQTVFQDLMCLIAESELNLPIF